MTLTKRFALTTAAAMLVSTAASAQMFGDDYGTDLSADTFNEGFAETGLYDGWDADGDAMLNENEFATGIYSDWDANGDDSLSQSEYSAGAERWYGEDYESDFAGLDTDQSGILDRDEFGAGWDNDYYSGWDADADGLLSEDEFGSGLYNTADLDQDQVISIEEEGWFEGWFDGNEVEAEIQETDDAP